MCDEWTRTVPFTEAALSEMNEAFHDQMGADRKCTCDDCPRRTICKLSYDGYNTDGDCLYDK